MATFVAMLRAVNVGGTGTLSMADLTKLCQKAGFSQVKTYIQSGNVVFKTPLVEAKVQATLENALSKQLGKPVAVLLRSASELDAVLAQNPFKNAVPSRVLVLFLSEAPPKNALAKLTIPGREEVKLHGREVLIHYPDGMGRSKLKLPLNQTSTGRNLNTVTKLCALAHAIEES